MSPLAGLWHNHAHSGCARRSHANPLRQLIEEAARTGARTLHIEPSEDGWQVRLRRAGGLSCQRHDRSTRLGTRLSRLARSGPHARIRIGTAVVHAEITETQTHSGPSWMVKVLRVPRAMPTLGELVTYQTSYRRLRCVLAQPCGLVVLSGQDSNATSLLRAAMAQHCVAPDRRVLCLEQAPVYQIPGAISCALTPELRADITRVADLDADVIVIGDVRLEPAAVATLVRVASRHVLVVLDCKARDIHSSLSILQELDPHKVWLPSRRISLVRHDELALLCESCRTSTSRAPDIKNKDASAWLDSMLHPLHEAHGCEQCNDSGIGGIEDATDVLAVILPSESSPGPNEYQALLKDLSQQRVAPAFARKAARAGLVSERDAERISRTSTDDKA